jgi:hypothetical protein
MLAEMRANAAPASTYADVAKSQQEDVSSMAMTSVQKLDANLDHLLDMLCIELLVAHRGLEAAAPRLDGVAMGTGTAQLGRYLADVLPKGPNGSPGEDLEALRHELRSGRLLSVLSAIQRGASDAEVARMRQALPGPSWELGEPAPAAVRAPLQLPTARSEWRPFGMQRSTDAPNRAVALGRDLYWPSVDHSTYSNHSDAELSAYLVGQGRYGRLCLPKGLRCYEEKDRHRTEQMPTDPQVMALGDTLAVNIPDATRGPTLLTRGRYEPVHADATWSEPLPGVKAHNVAFCSVPGKGLYALGGSPSRYLHRQQTSALCLDEQTQEWRALPALPIPRAGASAFYVKGRIYVVGGPPEPNRVDRFNTLTEQWEKPIFLRNDWSTDVSAWVDDEQIVLAAGKDAAGQWNAQVEVIDAADPARPAVKKAPGLGFEGVKSLKILDTEKGKVALGSDEQGAFALQWQAPEADEAD